jgi:hypothetical protein
VLSPIPIEATDQHGAALAVEPGLNVIAHMGRSVNPSILVMRNSDVLPLGVSDHGGKRFGKSFYYPFAITSDG